MFTDWRLLSTIKTNIELIKLCGEPNSDEPDPPFSHTHLAPAMQLEHIKDITNSSAFSRLAYSQNTVTYLHKLCISIVTHHAHTLLDGKIMSFTASCSAHDPLTVVGAELSKLECVLRAAIVTIGGKWVNLQFIERTTSLHDSEIGQILFSI